MKEMTTANVNIRLRKLFEEISVIIDISIIKMCLIVHFLYAPNLRLTRQRANSTYFPLQKAATKEHQTNLEKTVPLWSELSRLLAD